MKNKLVLNSVEDAEIISVRLDPERFPIAYANKVECLMLSGLSEEEAKKDVAGGVAVAPGRSVPAWPGRGCEWQ